MTYRENINNLKARQRINLSQRRRNTSDRINFQEKQEKEMIETIGDTTDLLVGSPGQAFSSGFQGKGFQTEGEGIFPTLYGEHVKRKREEGRKAADEDRAERLEKMVNHFEKLKDTDTAHHAVKRDMLLNGAYYDDADRFTKLSPHAQVGYAQQKLGLYKESYPDKLKQWMLKNSQKYSIYGQTVTPEELNNSNLYPPLLKEAMLNEAEADIKRQNGIDGFSDDMLTLAGVNDYYAPDGTYTQGVHSKAKADMMADYRKNYNIESSAKLVQLQFNEFLNSPDKDINRFLTVIGGTVDENNKMRDWSGAWTELENLLIGALRTKRISEKEIEEMFNQEIPGRPGKTYASEYRVRLRNILTNAKRQQESDQAADLAATDNDAKQVQINFEKKMQPGGELHQWIEKHGNLPEYVITNEYEKWKKAGGRNDGNMPEWLTDVVTREEQDQQAIIDNVEELLEKRGYYTAYDVRNATAKTLKEISQLPGAELNSQNAIVSGEQFRKTGKHTGFEIELTDALNAYVNRAALDKKEFNYGEMYDTLEADYLSIYRDLLNAGKLPPHVAHKAALHTVQAKLGFRPNAEGKTATAQETADYIEQISRAPDLTKLKESNAYEARRIDAAKNLIDKMMVSRRGGPLPDNKILLPGAGTNTKDWQDLVLYADSNGRKGEVSNYYTSVARLYPQFTVEDLVNHQLRAGGHDGLPRYSAFNEALKIEGLEELNRIIGYKPTPATTIQGKVEAIDASTMLRHASKRAELNLEQPARSPDDESLKADKESLGGLIEKEQQEANVEKYGHSGIPPNENDYKNTKGRWKSGGEAKYKAELKKYEKYKLEYEIDNPPTIRQGDPSSVWETKIIYKGTSVRNRKPVTVYRRLGDKEWSEEIPEGYVPPAEDISYLQSHFYRPDSPILAPYLVDYSVALFNEKVLNATAV